MYIPTLSLSSFSPALSPSSLSLALSPQVQKCSEEAHKGHYLPSDYHFTSHNGAKVLDSTSWAYPLCGVLGFLVPYSPSSASTPSIAGSRGNRRRSQQTGAPGISKDLL